MVGREVEEEREVEEDELEDVGAGVDWRDNEEVGAVPRMGGDSTSTIVSILSFLLGATGELLDE